MNNITMETAHETDNCKEEKQKQQSRKRHSSSIKNEAITYIV